MKSLHEYMNESLVKEASGTFDISYILPTIQQCLDDFIADRSKKYKEIKKMQFPDLGTVLSDEINKKEEGKNIGNPISFGMTLKSDHPAINGWNNDQYNKYQETVEIGSLEIAMMLQNTYADDKASIYISIKYKPNAKGKKLGAQQGTGMLDILGHEITVGADVVCTNVKEHGDLVQGVVQKIGGAKITVQAKQGGTLLANPKSCVVLTPDMLK